MYQHAPCPKHPRVFQDLLDKCVHEARKFHTEKFRTDLICEVILVGGGKSRQEKSADWNLSPKHPLQDVSSLGSRVSNAVETLSKKTRLRETNSTNLTPHSCVFSGTREEVGTYEGIYMDGKKPGQEVRVPH